MKAWYSTTASLFLLTCLAACSDSGGNADDGGNGNIADLPPPPPPPQVEEEDITNTPLPLHENFGEFTGFDQSDTIFFFSPEYKALATDNPDDPLPAFYHPTCCFWEDSDPNAQITVDHQNRLGIISDNGNPSLLVSDARFTLAQTLSELAGGGTDPRRDSTSGSDTASWGELDLSKPYRISFCVKAASGGSSDTQIYVDNNTTGEANSVHKGGSTRGSRIFHIPTGNLVPGERVEINVPGDIFLEPGESVEQRPELVGTEHSFLQMRVSSGGSVILDDLLIEYQDEDGQAALPACNVFTPATAPDAPEAPNLGAGDGNIRATWDGVVGAIQYDIAYGTENDVTQATLVEDATSPHTLEELENDTEYFVFLRVKNAVDWSDWSDSASAIPEATPEPVGDSCVPTSQVRTSIPWSVYDGCLSPSEEGSVVFDTSVQGTFDFGSSDDTLFTAVTNEDGEKLGTSVLDTREDDPDNQDFRSRGEFKDIFAPGFPKHFTAIARIKADDPAQRGFELQTYFGDAEKRVNLLLRPDQGSDQGRIHLEKFIDNSTDVKAEAPLQDGDFHIYHIAFTMTDADTLNAKVYIDGNDTPAIDETSTGRDAGGENKLRIGEDSSSEHLAEVDWIIWTTDTATTAMAPSELMDQLPEDIGELGVYQSTTWTSGALNLAGDEGNNASGSVLSASEDAITIRAAGGKLDSGSVQKFFAYQPLSGQFTFTARLKSVTTTNGEAFEASSNGNRFGIAVMESVEAPASGDFLDVGRFATIDYWVSNTTTPVFDGSRAHKLDVGATAESKRSRSNADIAIGDYLRIQIVDDGGIPRVIRSAAPANFPDDFTQLNSSQFKDEGGIGFPSSWYLGVFGAPKDDLTLEFDEITITQD